MQRAEPRMPGRTKNASNRFVIVAGDSGATLELHQAHNPRTTKTPDEYLRYGATGLTEPAPAVTDIDDLFQRVKAAGHETQTDYLGSPSPGLRSFLFHDPTARPSGRWKLKPRNPLTRARRATPARFLRRPAVRRSAAARPAGGGGRRGSGS